MTDKYWVPAAGTSTGTWDNATTTNWSLTSGGAGGAAVPTATDNVIFDANSDNGTTFTVTHSTGAACLSLTASALDFQMTLTGTTALTLSGSLTLPATNFVKGGTGTLTFSGGTANRTITTNGNTLSGSITINCAGFSVTLGSALTLASGRTFTFTNATTLDLAGYNVTSGNLTSTGATTRALTLGSGTITLTDASGTVLNFTGATNLALSAASSTLALTGAGASTKTFAGNGYTYGTVRLTGGSTGAYAFTGANTFGDIGNTGAGACVVTLPASTTQTLTTFSFTGTAGNLVTIQSATAGTAATISKASGVVSANYLSLKDSAATGGATFYAGANSTNVSGNSGWIFTAPPSGANTGAFFFAF